MKIKKLLINAGFFNAGKVFLIFNPFSGYIRMDSGG
jgi:hypothetical protein